MSAWWISEQGTTQPKLGETAMTVTRPRCTDCGELVTYDDSAWDPWRSAANGSHCPARTSGYSNAHRIPLKDAERMWECFYLVTGTAPRHDVTGQSYRYPEQEEEQ